VAARSQSGWWVVPALIVLVITSRVPAIRLPVELNPDEGQMLAQVMRVGIDPVPWRGVDGTTSGPLNTWFLYAAHAAGMPLDYGWAHALAAAMLALIAATTWVTLRLVAGPWAAAAGAAAAAVCIALSQGANFVHFSGELVPALLASLVLLCLAARSTRSRDAPVLDAVAALLVGVMPWTKLQSLPGAVVLGVCIGWHTWDAGGGPQRPGWRRLLLLAALATLPTLVVLAIVIGGGAWADFWTSYVIGNAAYVGTPDPLATARKALHLLQPPPGRLLVGTSALVLVWWALGRPGWRHASPPLRSCFGASAAVVVATTAAVLLPHVPFPHYQILLIGPLSVLAACTAAIGSGAGRARPAALLAAASFTLLVFGLPMTGMGTAVRNAATARAMRAGLDDTPERRIARMILAAAPGAHRMVVWGWMPSLYVETGIAPGTRHAVGHFVIEPGPARPHLRATLLADVRRERPEVIVDAVAAGCFRWTWGAGERLASFPDLAAYVGRNYVLQVEQRLEPGGDPVRIYVSREYLDRAARGTAG
jgi:hypothetical protein